MAKSPTQVSQPDNQVVEAPKLKRAATPTQLFNTKFDVLPFDGRWLNSFGMPERNKPWFIMAPVASGKTTFVSMLCKYLSKFGRVAYNSVEEGISASLKQAFKRAGITAKNKILVLDKESCSELTIRLKRHKSPDFIVIDTQQHSDMGKREYLKLKHQFPKKMFIIISHMDGAKPEGRVAKFIYQDAAVKIRIEGYKAFVNSRYGGNEPLVIWQDGADNYWGNGLMN
jgi:hypothetical protein